jgi:hypothetical protein
LGKTEMRGGMGAFYARASEAIEVEGAGGHRANGSRNGDEMKRLAGRSSAW